MNRYAEMRKRQQEEVNALPIGFAFGNRQFEEMMRGWGLDPEKTSIRSTGLAIRAVSIR